MALKIFFNNIRGLKVTELPNYIKPKLSLDYIKNSFNRGLDNYYTKYIETSSADPVYHVCFGGMTLSYLVNLPEERRHYKHLEHERLAKAHGSAAAAHHWSPIGTS